MVYTNGMKLVIIEGKTATGKTTLAKRLAHDLDLPAFLKDAYKERRFDALGRPPTLRQWVEIENASWRVLHDAVKAAIQDNESLIIEGNFVPKVRRQLRKLIPPDCTVVEIFCFAKGRTLLQRYIRRNQSGERHRGHLDHLWYGSVLLEMAAARLGFHWVKPLAISDKLLLVDTSDFSAVDYDKIKRFIKASLG